MKFLLREEADTLFPERDERFAEEDDVKEALEEIDEQLKIHGLELVQVMDSTYRIWFVVKRETKQ